MTFPQYYELCEYWADYPPTHEILKLVHKVERAAAKQHMDAESFAAFMKSTGGKMEGLSRA